jgi:hypothetical protein
MRRSHWTELWALILCVLAVIQSMPLDWLPKWSEEGQKTINIGVLFSLSFLGWQIAELYRRGESKEDK